MEIISVQLEGELLIDLFAYRGFLYGWNFENQLVVYSVEALIERLGSVHGLQGLSAAYALFCSRGIGATPAMKSAFQGRSPGQSEILSLTAEPLVRAENISPFKHVIDMHITYDRLYLATDAGLFICPLISEALIEERAIDLGLEYEGECISVSTGLRAVGASFGTSGLYVVANESSELLGPRRSWFLPITSVRSSLGGGTLANFPSQEEMQTIPVQVTRGERAREVALSEVTVTDSALLNTRTVGSDGYLFWDPRYRRMFDVASQRRNVVGRWYVDPAETELSGDEAPSHVISAAFTGNYFLVLETSAGIVAVREGEDQLFQSGSTISVRTYRNSWRYRRLVTSTSRDGVWLHATLDGF